MNVCRPCVRPHIPVSSPRCPVCVSPSATDPREFSRCSGSPLPHPCGRGSLHDRGRAPRWGEGGGRRGATVGPLRLSRTPPAVPSLVLVSPSRLAQHRSAERQVRCGRGDRDPRALGAALLLLFLRPVLARPTSPSRTKAGPARSRPRSCLISSGASPPHPLQAGGVEPGQPALRCATRLSEVKQDSVQPPPWNGPHGHTWGENAIIHVLSCLLGPKAAQRGAAGVAQHAEHVPHPPAPRSLLV